VGAVQNRLTRSIANLSVSVENLTAAESSIRDADIAEEVAELTRNQILVQTATAMVGQANLIPQSVLQLLG
jgi:flagellin